MDKRLWQDQESLGRLGGLEASQHCIDFPAVSTEDEAPRRRIACGLRTGVARGRPEVGSWPQFS